MTCISAFTICLVCTLHVIEGNGKHSDRQRSVGSKSGSSGLAGRVSELESLVQSLQAQLNEIQSCCQPVFEHIVTSDQYIYKVIEREFITVPGDETFMLFQVKSCGDAHILLMQSNRTTEDSYELVIAGLQNSQSFIRDGQQGPALATTYHAESLLDCKEFRPFWVSWDEGNIRVGTGLIVDVNDFISYANTTLTGVKHVAIATGREAIGKWMIYDNACPCLK